MNSIWPASANSWEDGAAAHPTRTGDSSERCKQSADTEPTNHCPRKQGYTCTLYQKPQLGDTVRSTLLGWHHPWASQPVQLKKYPWYQGSRHHLWSVAYALNYPFHQLSDKVLPALHSHIKDTTQLFQLDRIFDCFWLNKHKEWTSLLQALPSFRKHHWSKGGQREILSC